MQSVFLNSILEQFVKCYIILNVGQECFCIKLHKCVG